jgi:hypothetical protein
MDSASTPELAAAVELAYACCNETEEAWEISVDVGSDDGLFIGGDFDPRAFGELTSVLREVRQRVEHPDPLEVERVRASLDRLLGTSGGVIPGHGTERDFAAPGDHDGDPFFRRLFECS